MLKCFINISLHFANLDIELGGGQTKSQLKVRKWMMWHENRKKNSITIVEIVIETKKINKQTCQKKSGEYEKWHDI